MTQSGLLASARKSQTVAFTDGLFTATIQPTAIVVGVAGDVIGQLLEDTTDRTFKLGAGVHPLRFKSITESGTTATNLIVVRG